MPWAGTRPIVRATSRTRCAAAPKRGSIVETYQTVSVICTKCNHQLFRYKKRNGTKSALVKCYVERMVDDTTGSATSTATEHTCPQCETRFARSAVIKGLPALKLVGGKVRMTK